MAPRTDTATRDGDSASRLSRINPSARDSDNNRYTFMRRPSDGRPGSGGYQPRSSVVTPDSRTARVRSPSGPSRSYRVPDNTLSSRGYFIGDRYDYSRRSGVYSARPPLRPTYCHSRWRQHCGYRPYSYSSCYRPCYPRRYSRYSFAFGFGFSTYPSYYYDPYYYSYPYYTSFASYPVYVPTPVYTGYPVISGYPAYSVDPYATMPVESYDQAVVGTVITEQPGGYAETPSYGTDPYAGVSQPPATGYTAPPIDSVQRSTVTPDFGAPQESFSDNDYGWSEVLEPDDMLAAPSAPSAPSVSMPPQAPAAPAEPQPLDAAAEQEIHGLMVQGVELFSKGDYQQAAGLFGQVMNKYNDNVDAILAYGVARFATGEITAAAEAIRQGVRLAPDVVDIPFDLRDRYGQADDFGRHLQALEDFVRSDPANVDGWLVLGFVRHFTGDRELASNTFDILKRRSTDDADLAELFLSARPIDEENKPVEPIAGTPAGGAS
ncbi:MAG: tetratricopeptide repeat protein [Phycisphaerales bacterium]|nr:tetratricopeptide repeat protein [Phycisphaerales bacterium]